MRYTLLEIVQRILESMDSDEVNSIADTTEAQAVANIVKEKFFEIVSEIGMKEHENLFHLNASTDSAKPCVMYLPSNVSNIESLKYNVGPSLDDFNLRELKYLDLGDFLFHVNNLNTNEAWVFSQILSLDGDDFRFKYRNDQSPSYWTSTDDYTIVFDSFDSSYEDTLTSSRTYGYGLKVPIFLLEDTFVPDLDPRQFSLLIAGAKAQAFIELKQSENPNAARTERRHRILAQKDRDNTDPRTAIQRHKGYGRR